MAFRFFTRKTLFPGVTLNMSRSGPSISVGPRGFRHTIGGRGRRTTVGLPGTGLHYSVQHKKKISKSKSQSIPETVPTPSVDTGIAQAEDDRVFLRSVIAFQNGAELGDLSELGNLAAGDAKWILGICALRSELWDSAIRYLRAAIAAGDLGDLCVRNEISLQVPLSITPEVMAHIEPEELATKLALVEALQGAGDLKEALGMLKKMNASAPDDFLISMSLAEVAFELDDGRSMSMTKLAEILSYAKPDPDLAWVLWFHTARAQTRSGLHREAIRSYENAMGHPEVPEDMHKLAWYEKALTYAEAGDATRSRQELSGIYAVDKCFADVEDRLRGNRTY